MILTLVRHGEPVRDAVGRDRADPGLSALGRLQLEEARPLVEADGYDVVFCSPMRRARESLKRLLPGVEAIIEPGLSEFDRDAGEYLHWEDGAEVYQAYLAGDLSHWGTTLGEFRERIHVAVERMRAVSDGARVLAVTHGGVINNLFSSLVGSPRVSLFKPAYGSVNRFAHHPEEGWTVAELNASGPRSSPLQ